MPKSVSDKVMALVRKKGVLRPRDLDAHGIPREYLIRLYRQGRLTRPGRGIYTASDAPIGENQMLAEACERVPLGIVCLLSALQYHGLTTQSPFQIWMALDYKARKPKVDYLPLRIVRFSGPALEEGVEIHTISKVKARVYCSAKTVADCFKYRNKIGLDVALEALRDCRRQKKASMDELWKYAKICRVARVMQPYMESLA